MLLISIIHSIVISTLFISLLIIILFSLHEDKDFFNKIIRKRIWDKSDTE